MDKVTSGSGVTPKKYQLVFMGLWSDERRFREMMSLRGVKPSLIDQMLREAPIIVKQNLSMQSARKYAETLSAMGARVTILDQTPPEKERNGGSGLTPMSSFVPCPQCGLVQSGSDTCPRCGFRLADKDGKGEACVASDRT